MSKFLTVMTVAFFVIGCTSPGAIGVSGSGGGGEVKAVYVDGHKYIVLIGPKKAAICPAVEELAAVHYGVAGSHPPTSAGSQLETAPDPQ